jgi:hypothetical protein
MKNWLKDKNFRNETVGGLFMRSFSIEFLGIFTDVAENQKEGRNFENHPRVGLEQRSNALENLSIFHSILWIFLMPSFRLIIKKSLLEKREGTLSAVHAKFSNYSHFSEFPANGQRCRKSLKMRFDSKINHHR